RLHFVFCKNHSVSQNQYISTASGLLKSFLHDFISRGNGSSHNENDFSEKPCVVPEPRTRIFPMKNIIPKSKFCLEVCFKHNGEREVSHKNHYSRLREKFNY